ncbi:NAD-glutamate dehydrogenase [Streptomyces sp. NBC_00133]|uniref:hypothetical protein n=1 Tax=Streptomyces sp. NBC_00133 TaxID=2903624 RepID=UPI00324A3644
MQTKLDAAKSELLARAVAAAQSDRTRPAHNSLPTGALTAYLRDYYLHTAHEDLVDRDPVDVCGAALSHYRLGLDRPQGSAAVRAHTPTVEEDGWSCGGTVVEVVSHDMPFLVASVTHELSRQGHAIHMVVHPQLAVRRDITGKLLEILDVDDCLPSRSSDAGWPADAAVESWMHIEIDRETDATRLRRLEADLRRVLTDVRCVAEDWSKMRASALRIADELAERPPAGMPEQEAGDAWELLRWLAHDHFIFLGYREYELAEADDDRHEALRSIPGTGLGILRHDPRADADDHPAGAASGRLSAAARANARERKLLVITKADSRATVHRSSYLDYIGVKRFDAEGAVIGERRFFGLFSSAAYIESVTRVPVVRRNVHELLAARLSQAARSWMDGFNEALTAECGEERATEPARRYAHAFPDGHRADFSPRTAVTDVRHIESSTTVLVNNTVSSAGTTFLYRMWEETGASGEEIVRAHTAARAIFGLEQIWSDIEALDNQIPASVQTTIRLHSRRLLERATRWLLNNRRQPLDVAATIEIFRDRCNLVRTQLPTLLAGTERDWYEEVLDELTDAGVPAEPAQRVAGFSSAFPALDIVAIADRTGTAPLEIAEVYYDLADRLRITQLRGRIIELPRTDRWQAMARAAIRDELFAAHAALTADVLACGTPGDGPRERFDTWGSRNASPLSRARGTLADIETSGTHDLTSLSVAMRVIHTLVRSGSTRV